MYSSLYLLKALTNLHPGSEGSNAGIIDNQVQRDAITGIPVIHTSSIKGSLRELFEEVIYPTEAGNAIHQDIIQIFGNTSHEKNQNRIPDYSFFQAEMLSIPVQSNCRPFFNATSPEVLGAFLNQVQLFQSKERYEEYDAILRPLIDHAPCENEPRYFGPYHEDIRIDDIFFKPRHVPSFNPTDRQKELVGNNIVVMHDTNLKQVCSRLPLIARNKLNNGTSKNLWYEEVVPRETRFWFYVVRKKQNSLLQVGLNSKNLNYFQIGGNASVGYGLAGLNEE